MTKKGKTNYLSFLSLSRLHSQLHFLQLDLQASHIFLSIVTISLIIIIVFVISTYGTPSKTTRRKFS